MSRQRLKIVHNQNSTEELLFQANVRLAEGYLQEALKLYSRVLYGTSPGHIIAFLNRSLVYVALGFPELAVTDAYRAAISCNEMRLTNSKAADRRVQAVAKYLRAEFLHIKGQEIWTTTPRCFIGSGEWMKCTLASIIIKPSVDPSSRNKLCTCLEVRAIYRMCGAMYMCGGGACSEALGILEDTISTFPDLSPHDTNLLKQLGEKVLRKVECVMQMEDHAVKLEDISTEYDVRDMGCRALMKAKVTYIERKAYPMAVLGGGIQESRLVVERTNLYIDGISRKCQFDEHETEDGSLNLTLRATQDIFPGEEILSEPSNLHVTTASPEQVSEMFQGKSPSFYCDACAALMITTERFRGKFIAGSHTSGQTNWNWPTSGSGSPTERNTSMASDEDMKDLLIVPISSPLLNSVSPPPQIKSRSQPLCSPFSPNAAEPPTPPEHEHSSTDFQLCIGCHQIALCSEHCRLLAEPSHCSLCTTGVEYNLYKQLSNTRFPLHLPPSSAHTLYTHPKAQYLYDLLFLRIFAGANKDQVHPLASRHISWLGSDTLVPHVAHTSTSTDTNPLSSNIDHSIKKYLPWSFTTNVVRPIQYLHDYLEGQGIDPWKRLVDCDGWVLNTLLWKIMHGTRITRGSRITKIYDDEGRIVGGCGVGGGGDEEVWVGSLHVGVALLRLEREGRPNVFVGDAEGGVASVIAIDAGGKRNGPDDEGMDVDTDTQASRKKEPNAEGEGVDMDLDGPGDERETTPIAKIPCIKAGMQILRAPFPTMVEDLPRSPPVLRTPGREAKLPIRTPSFNHTPVKDLTVADKKTRLAGGTVGRGGRESLFAFDGCGAWAEVGAEGEGEGAGLGLGMVLDGSV